MAVARQRLIELSTPSPSAAQTSVIGKVVAILEALSTSSGRMGLSELAGESGVAKSTVHRLCLDLSERGIVDRVGDGWCLGPKLFELGQRVPARRRLRDITLPYLEDLYIATKHTVHLAALERDNVLYVEKLAGRDAVATPSEVAGRMPLHCTATGKCLLAHASPEVLERVLSQGLHPLTPNTICAPAVLLEQLEQVRACGVAMEHDEYADGFSSIAAPIFGMLGTALGAIAVTSASEHFNEATLVPLVTAAAAKATARFGGRQPR